MAERACFPSKQSEPIVEVRSGRGGEKELKRERNKRATS